MARALKVFRSRKMRPGFDGAGHSLAAPRLTNPNTTFIATLPVGRTCGKA